MVKDDLAAFQAVCDIYNQCSRWQAIKDFFRRVPNHLSLGFGFSVFVLVLFSIALGCVLFSFATKGQQDWLLYTIMGALLFITGFHIYLTRKYGLPKQQLKPYERLLTNSYYQCERYFTFRDKLRAKFNHDAVSVEVVKTLIQNRLQLDQGMNVLKVWLLGIGASIVISILYSLAPDSDQGKTYYIAVISFFLLVSLFYVYGVHDPLMFKNNKYRELLLFLSVYESEGNISRCLSQNLNLANSSGTEHGL